LDLLVIWPIDDSNIVISKTKSVIIVIWHLSKEDIKLSEKSYSDNMSEDDNWHWELWYVVVTETGSVANRWKGRCFVCYGGQQFPWWWKYDRGMGGPVKLNSSDLDANDYLLWDVAVFFWEDNDSFDHFCDAYLGYIGGQPNNYCKKHDMPLIVVVNRKGCWMQCMCMDGEASQQQCGKTGFLCCAKHGCPVILCRRHAVLILWRRMKFDCYVVWREWQYLEEMDCCFRCSSIAWWFRCCFEGNHLRMKLIHLRMIACWREMENRFL
jgi:hypothetical protein